MTALRRLASGCRGCPDHKEDWDRTVYCIHGYYKKHPKLVPPEDIALMPDFCPRTRKLQED